MALTETMMSLLYKTKRGIRSNSPVILAAGGVIGTLATAYLASKATYRAAKIISDLEKKNEGPVGVREQLREYAPLVWDFYVPAGIVGLTTVGCIVGSAYIGNKRMASVGTALSLSQAAFSEYKDKIVEQLGERKEQAVRDEIAQDHVTKTAPSSEVVLAGYGHILCCELYTRRYFTSDMVILKTAQNEINSTMLHGIYATLGEFYELIGLPLTSASSNLGWDNDRMMELEFSTVLTETGKPCLAFDYNYVKPV